MNEIIKSQLEELKSKANFYNNIMLQSECERDKCINDAITAIMKYSNSDVVYFNKYFKVLDIYEIEIYLDRLVYDGYGILIGSDGMNQEEEYNLEIFSFYERLRIIDALEQKVFNK